MKVRVIAEADWLPELDAHLTGTVVTRGDDPADLLVVAWDAVSDVLDAFDDQIPVPVVWVVPRDAARMELERLSDTTPLARFIFEATAGAVATAVDGLAGQLGVHAEAAAGDEDGGAGTGTGAAAVDAASAAPAESGRVRESMDELWRQFQVTMLDRLAVLEAVGAEVLEGDVDAERLADAHHAAHKLHGSLGTFGVHYGSRLAAELESLMEESLDSGELSAGDRYRYSEIVVGLRQEIESGGSTDPSRHRGGGPEPDREAGLLLIVEADPDRRRELVAAGGARGWRPHPAATPVEALDGLDHVGRPVLAILDSGAGDPEELERLVDRLVSGTDPVPVVFQGRTRSLEKRLRAVTMGARVFVDREAGTEAVMARAESLIDQGNAGGRVLVVDDDPDVLRVLTFILRGAGYSVRTLSSPLGFWRKLEAVEPDVLILDIEMPDVSGLHLCRVVRADDRWSTLPVLLLSGRTDPDHVVGAFDAGGDDIVAKPVAGPELLARIERIAQPARMGPAVDEGPDRAARQSPVDRLGTQLAIAARHDEPVTVAQIRLDEADAAQGSLDRAVDRLYRRIRDAARDVDVVVRWGRDRLVVARYAEGAEETGQWLDGLLSASGVPARVGLAAHTDHETPEAMLEAAGAELGGGAAEDVREAGRDRASSEPVEGGGPDIVIVEDDEALGTLVRQTLEDRGYETHWIRDGADAAELLTGRAPAMRPSVIILDVGLPGMDGLSLLRRLARDGVIRRTRVLMLTARSAESEVVKALELGAFDHVPKPFSVSELVHRVRRALGDREAR